MNKTFAKIAFAISVGAMAWPALAVNFSPENIPVSATGQVVIYPNNPGTFNSIACNIALSGDVNQYGNVIFSSGTVSGAAGCSSIKVGTANSLVAVSANQVSYQLLLIDEPSPLRIIFECSAGSGQAFAGWNNTTSQVIFNNSADGTCTLSGALTITPAVTIQ